MRCARSSARPSAFALPFAAIETLAPEDLLRNVPFFRDLDRVSVARLVGALEERRVPKGADIVREGDEADGLYLLSSGEVTVTLPCGGDVEGATLRAPAHFGDMGVLLA